MGRRALVTLLATALVLVAAGPARAAGFTKTEYTPSMDLPLGASSTVAGGNLLYLTGVPRGSLTVGKVTMSLPVLRATVSRP